MINKRNENAISELLGTMLLLLIAVAAFSYIYFQFISDNGPAPETYVNLVGTINGQNLTITHKGGESLDAQDTITFTVAGAKETCLIKDYLNDNNSNGKWDLGETILYPFVVNLHYLDQYEFIDVQAIDSVSNSIAFQGPVSTKYKSDVGIWVRVNNTSPVQGQLVTITVSAWCLGGDLEAAGGVIINCTLPPDLNFVNYTAEQGTYNNASGMWHLGNLLVEESPVNLTIHARVTTVPYHEQTQLGIIFDASDYTSGSTSVFQNTYLSGLMFAIDPSKYNIFPTDGKVELTVVICGWNDPPRAEIVLDPTIINDENAHRIATGGGLRNTGCAGGDAPISSAIRLVTDQMYNSKNFLKQIRQIVLIISSGQQNCIWDKTTANGYGGIVSKDQALVKTDTINAAKYLYSTFEFNESNDELDAITVAKVLHYRDSSFLNESIVMPQPGNIYSVTRPIVDPGWVFEVDPGHDLSDSFQKAFNYILKILLNSMTLDAMVDDSTTIDPNSNNNFFSIQIQPVFV